MRKLGLLFVITMALFLTACGADKNIETSESGNTAPEITTNTKETQEVTTTETTTEPTTETTTETTTEPTTETTTEKETPASAENETQPRTEGDFELTEQGKTFLEQMCKTLNNFDSQTARDEAFWREFLFYSYTGASDTAETEQIPREDLGFDETVVKISLEEAQAHAKLVLGLDLPDTKPSFEDMEKGQTSCYYQDGYYYIGVSDFPDYQYKFADYEESDQSITVRYTIDFMGESNVGTVSFTLVPDANENGFIITSKTTEFSE